MKFRASQLGKIMTSSRTKGEVLGQTAKSYIIEQAKQDFYGYTTEIKTKPMIKGTDWEQEGIDLLNSVRFTQYTKNELRVENEFMTGCCDIITDDSIIDIKSSWSLSTFPVLASQGEDKTYEWQGRAYMMLWDMDEFEIDYCLVSTPEHLIGYENPAIHNVDHITPELRVTRVLYKRDKALEDKIKMKVEEANKFYEQIIKQISKEHEGNL